MSRQDIYISSGRNGIDGWFSRVDAEIFGLVTQFQNAEEIAGGVAEIGLHHGKSFIALCLALKGGEKAYGIDIFDEQAHNLDLSGSGDQAVLETNLDKFGVPRARVVLDKRESQKVAPQEIRDAVGPIRFFSVDGGHWFDVVVSDLRLAEASIGEKGVVAIDDFLRPEWPDVSAAFFHWYEQSEGALVPFAIGFNKVYLCRKEAVAAYQAVLEDSAFLGAYLSKHYDFLGSRIPIFQNYHLPEFGVKRRVFEYMKLYHPNFYSSARNLWHSFF
jgi:hypothetical protein